MTKEVTTYKLNADFSITMTYGGKEISFPQSSLIGFYKTKYTGLVNYKDFTFSMFWNTAMPVQRINFLSELMRYILFGY